MKKILFVKLQIVCLVFAAHGYFNVTLASSIQFAIDASLNQQELGVIRDVVATISQAADESDSIGVVVYDGVFQRGTPIAIADAAQKQGILETLSRITPSDTSNLAVGIEKGTSELAAEGGYLIVFGQSEIQVTDAEKLTTYTEWLTWVLLPDSEKAGIEILLASPPAQNEAASFQKSVTAFFPISDANSLINDLSTVLPEPLVNRLGDPIQLSSLPELTVSDVQVPALSDAQAPLDVAIATPSTEPEISNVVATEALATVEEENQSTNTNLLLIGISIALLGALVAAGILILKLFRKSKQRPTAVNAQGIQRAAHINSSTAYMPSESRQGASFVSDSPTVARKQPARHEKSDYNLDDSFADGDETVQNPAVPPHNLDATLPRSQRVETDWDIKQEAETSDDLDEIRALTKQREESMI